MLNLSSMPYLILTNQVNATLQKKIKSQQKKQYGIAT